MNTIEIENLQEDLFFLISYLLTSARGLYGEPKEYGVFRLLDTTARLLEIMETHHLADDPFYQELQLNVQNEMAGSMSDDGIIERLDEIIALITVQIQKKLSH